MGGLAPGRHPTHGSGHRRAGAPIDPDAGVCHLDAPILELGSAERRDPLPPAPSSCLLCAEELGVDAVIVRHQGLLLAFGCLDCLRSYLAMTDSPATAVGCCNGATAGCSPASEWCV